MLTILFVGFVLSVIVAVFFERKYDVNAEGIGVFGIFISVILALVSFFISWGTYPEELTPIPYYTVFRGDVIEGDPAYFTDGTDFYKLDDTDPAFIPGAPYGAKWALSPAGYCAGCKAQCSTPHCLLCGDELWQLHSECRHEFYDGTHCTHCGASHE